MYAVGMLCKHFKGITLLEKNIYQIQRLNVDGISILGTDILYTGNSEDLEEVHDLVIYSNIFQENKIFAREYDDLASELTKEKQRKFHQMYRVEPLTEEEVSEIQKESFIQKKKQMYQNYV